ncbi:trypsin-like serine peptidase [Pantoea allii]|uniref:trypsin-like serine peptidase n=1 Tax=Pantoea allii TaxID=574096 RepID=UPI003D30F8FE
MREKLLLLPVSVALAFQSHAAVPEVTFNLYKNKDAYWTAEKLQKAAPMEAVEAHRIQPTHEVYQNKEPSPDLSSENKFRKRPRNMDGMPTKANIEVQPYRTAGKLFFSDDSGKNKYCSAQYIKSKNLLLTAGHCVRNAVTKKWYSHFIFYPRYSNGPKDKSTGWLCATTWSDYTKEIPGWSQNWGKDYAFIYTLSPSKNGYLGYRINSTEKATTAIGYPGNYEKGHYLMAMSGTQMRVTGSPVIEMQINRMRSGNSGGAWIVNFSDNNVNSNYVTGINSFHYTNKPDSEFSPLFDKDFITLMNFSNNKCLY